MKGQPQCAIDAGTDCNLSRAGGLTPGNTTTELTLGNITGGGSVISTLPSGKKVFVWGGLPGECVRIKIIKDNAKFAEGIVTELLEASEKRVEPKDFESYLSTSPFQIYDFAYENSLKLDMVKQAFALHKLDLPQINDVYHDTREYNYRNKYNFAFCAEKGAAAFGVTKRGTHDSIYAKSISLPNKAITDEAEKILEVIRRSSIKPCDLKSLLIRSNEGGGTASASAQGVGAQGVGAQGVGAPSVCSPSASALGVGAAAVAKTVSRLYVLTENIKEREFESLKNFEIVFYDSFLGKQGKHKLERQEDLLYSSNKKPLELEDYLLSRQFTYGIDSFFQVNKPVYERVLNDMQKFNDNAALQLVDMFSGVGTIGLTLARENQAVSLVEVDKASGKYAKRNVGETQGTQAGEVRSTGAQAWAAGAQQTAKPRVIMRSAERALDYIIKDSLLVVDPPRAGLHKALTKRINDEKPRRVLYLSCNPATQARDLLRMQDSYKIVYAQPYNFFPKTAHIENLVVLEAR